jgi:hypothetical protein
MAMRQKYHEPKQMSDRFQRWEIPAREAKGMHPVHTCWGGLSEADVAASARAPKGRVKFDHCAQVRFYSKNAAASTVAVSADERAAFERRACRLKQQDLTPLHCRVRVLFEVCVYVACW